MSFIKKLKKNGPNNYYHRKNNSVWYNSEGDSVHVCDIEKYKETELAQNYIDLLNVILSDELLIDALDKRLDALLDS